MTWDAERQPLRALLDELRVLLLGIGPIPEELLDSVAAVLGAADSLDRLLPEDLEAMLREAERVVRILRAWREGQRAPDPRRDTIS